MREAFVHSLYLIILTFLTLQLFLYNYCSKEFNFFTIGCSICGHLSLSESYKLLPEREKIEKEMFLIHQLCTWRKNW